MKLAIRRFTTWDGFSLVLLVMACATMGRVAMAQNTAEVAPHPKGNGADLWLIAGQSNCAGFAMLKEAFEPDPAVLFFGSAKKWLVATEPMEEMFYPHGDAHGMVTDYTLKPMVGGVGSGLFFAKQIR